MGARLIEIARERGWPLSGLLQDVAGFRVGPGREFKQEAADGDCVAYVCVKSGLKVEREFRECGNAVVITTRLSNPADGVSGSLDLVDPLYIALDYPITNWRVICANGGTTEHFYPPTAYRTIDVLGAWGRRFESDEAGLSSNLHLPLLVMLAGPEPDAEGFFCGLEWSGEWHMDCDVLEGENGFLAAGPKVRGLQLDPGEELELPPAHLGFFRGGTDAATNALRRYLYDNVCPPYDGKPTLPRVSYDHWFGIGNCYDIELMKKQADRAAELGVEMFVVDAAWFPGDFPEGVGNWHGVDEEKFPDGLEPLADYVRAHAMVFGLWFEPERAVAGTSAVEQHPEMFVEAASWGGRLNYHMNLARTDAQDFLIETVGGWIERLDLCWSRWDYNIEPHVPWEKLDPTGKIQFAYMDGLYRVLDTLMREHPRWMVEGCASGGRRIDIGTMKRAHTFWFSDQTLNPYLCRYMQARANRFLPGHLCNSSVAVGRDRGDAGFNDTAVLSRMLGKLAFDGDIASWSPDMTKRMAALANEFKQIRHLLVQDFYQLLAMPASVDDWDAVEFVSYDGADAALFAFAGAGGGEQVLRPKGLVAEADYDVCARPDGEPRAVAGAELMGEGLCVELGPLEGGLWRICRCSLLQSAVTA